MENAAVSGNLHVEWKVRLVAVLPVDLEAEEVGVELFRLGFVENPQNRCGRFKFHAPAPATLRGEIHRLVNADGPLHSSPKRAPDQGPDRMDAPSKEKKDT